MTKEFHAPFGIGRFTKGAVVMVTSGLNTGMIGHVEGFSLNVWNEVVVTVSLATCEVRQYHHLNLDVL